MKSYKKKSWSLPLHSHLKSYDIIKKHRKMNGEKIERGRENCEFGGVCFK
ncbi:hypothetical protein X929_09520 [Petrotoga olearia DSM 13574]|uniref:Uncharacterized protein n=1 Tax=Petrotoga olearia DSM 13574 TaxID=1122955 RepID=A0A2K1NXL2_9BACT|nr:hypothetical protein X929_09520 [Petrotoga olearia DSM 13574]